MIVVTAYVAAIGMAEAIGVFAGVASSVLCHALLLLTLLSHYALKDEAPYRRILPALALTPLLRILSLTMVIRQVPQIYWYALVGIPLLVAVALTVRLLDFSWAGLGLGLRSWSAQLLIALHGLPLGLAAFLIFQPEPLIARLDWRTVVIGSAILVIFTGFTEEIVFRGLLQRIANEAFGRTSILYSSVLFSIMYMGSLSLGYVFFIGLVGIFFGWCVKRTDSIWGVVLAHGLLNVGMLLVWPVLLR